MAKHITAFEAPEQSPGYLLWKVSTTWRRAIEGELKLLGLTHPQFVILAVTWWLRQQGKPTQIEIGKMAGLDPNTTSQVLRSLQAKQLIKRLRTKDTRSKNPTLTEQGFELLQKAMPVVEAADTQFFKALNATQMEAFQSCLQELG